MGVRYLSSQIEIDTRRKNWDTLLIDFDGTLVDYYYSEKMALTGLFNEEGLNSSEAQQAIQDYRVINEQYWKKFEKNLIDIESVKTRRFADLANQYQLDIDPSDFNDRYLESFIAHVKPFDGAFSALEKLFYNSDYNLVVVTNGIDYVQKKRLELTGIDQIIHYLITSGGVGYSKPSPEIFDISLRSVGATYKSTCMIGDSLSSDIKGANNLGIITCLIDGQNAYANQEPTPDLISPSFVDFVDWVSSN